MGVGTQSRQDPGHGVKGGRSRVVWEFNPRKRPVDVVSRRLPRKVNPTRGGVGPFVKENEKELVPSDVIHPS